MTSQRTLPSAASAAPTETLSLPPHWEIQIHSTEINKLSYEKRGK